MSYLWGQLFVVGVALKLYSRIAENESTSAGLQGTTPVFYLQNSSK